MSTNTPPMKSSSTQNNYSSPFSGQQINNCCHFHQKQITINITHLNLNNKTETPNTMATNSSPWDSSSPSSLSIQSTEELEQFFDSFDTNGDGEISEMELVDDFSSLGFYDSDDDGRVSELIDAFKLFDQDADGLISPTELHLVLTHLGMFSSVEECDGMIRSVDSDGGGKVNFEEFQKIMRTANANNSSASSL